MQLNLLHVGLKVNGTLAANECPVSAFRRRAVGRYDRRHSRAARNSRVASAASRGNAPCLPGCTCIRLSCEPIVSNSSSAPSRSKISSSHWWWLRYAAVSLGILGGLRESSGGPNRVLKKANSRITVGQVRIEF